MPDPNQPDAAVKADRSDNVADEDLTAIVRSMAPSRIDPGLYMTAMPIGNAEDITVRALRVLAAADVIACEDTRHSGRLLARYGIRASLIPYHDHNAERIRPKILGMLTDGAVVALISDAGTPSISDPGLKLLREAVSRDIMVTCLPGASAVLTAVVLSGLATDRFLFAGFPPAKAVARARFLEELEPVAATLVFFESPRRLPESLEAMAERFGDREVAVARELTKRFEEVRRGRLGDLAAHYRQAGAPKGEVVVVVGAAPTEAPSGSIEGIDSLLDAALAEGLSVRDAVDRVQAVTGSTRRTVYRRALARRGGA